MEAGGFDILVHGNDRNNQEVGDFAHIAGESRKHRVKRANALSLPELKPLVNRKCKTRARRSMDRGLHFANANAKVFRFPHIRGSTLNETINRRVFSFSDAFFPSSFCFTCGLQTLRFSSRNDIENFRKFWENKNLSHSFSSTQIR